MADVISAFTENDNVGNENCNMPPPCLPSSSAEKTKVTSEGSKEKSLLNEKKETVAEAEHDHTAENICNVEAESSNMPPPCLPSKPPEKTEITNEGSKEKAPLKEKKESVPELPYKVPSWSGIPEDLFSLEVLKNGRIVSTIDLTSKPFHVFGRLPNCDVTLEHPSVSRYHAVIQYKTSDTSNSEKGFYIYDLGSTHGTIVNKSPLEPRRYYRLRVGYVFKFGGSSRLFILQGPEESEESESNPSAEHSVTKGSEVGRVMTEEEYEEWKKEKEGGRQSEDDTGIDWGMGEDAVEEPGYPSDFGEVDKEAEEHHFKDPKKTLRGFFEREGLELEYDVEEKGPGHAKVFLCRVKLPIDGPGGDPIYAEAAVTGKKKEAVLECAKEACRLLDVSGLLRQSSHESKKHKEKNWEENDFYDSDEDSFLDRTGSVEKKRIQRMKRAGKDQPTTETYESLTSKLQMLDDEIKSFENKLQQDAAGKDGLSAGAADSLDDFMSSLGTSMDKTTRTQIRRKVFELKKERQGLVKIVNIAKPASLPAVAEPSSTGLVPVKNEASKSIESESQSSDSTPNTTVDKNTNSRHESSSLLKQITLKESSTDEHSLSKEDNDSHQSNSPEKNQEFAVPIVPSSRRRKSRNPNKVVAKTQDRNETENIGEKETCNITPEDSESRQGRKRNGSDGETGAQLEQNMEAPENCEKIPKKKKKRSYNVPTQWQAENDPTYAAWLPPEGQTGDGRTHLNEKFGY